MVVRGGVDSTADGTLLLGAALTCRLRKALVRGSGEWPLIFARSCLGTVHFQMMADSASPASAAAQAKAKKAAVHSARSLGDVLRPSRYKAVNRQTKKKHELGLPIKFSNDDGRADDYPWLYFGLHIGRAVWVVGKHDKLFLHVQGFFGKGMLSKAEPVFGQTVRQLNQRKIAATTTERQLQRKLNRERLKHKRKKRKEQQQQQQQLQVQQVQAQVQVQAQQQPEDIVPTAQSDATVEVEEMVVVEEAVQVTVEEEEDEEQAEEAGEDEEEEEEDADEDDEGEEEVQQDGSAAAAASLNGPAPSKSSVCRLAYYRFLSQHVLQQKKKFQRCDEYLQLGLEEAFFLSFGLNCLRIKREQTDTVCFFTFFFCGTKKVSPKKRSHCRCSSAGRAFARRPLVSPLRTRPTTTSAAKDGFPRLVSSLELTGVIVLAQNGRNLTAFVACSDLQAGPCVLPLGFFCDRVHVVRNPRSRRGAARNRLEPSHALQLAALVKPQPCVGPGRQGHPPALRDRPRQHHPGRLRDPRRPQALHHPRNAPASLDPRA